MLKRIQKIVNIGRFSDCTASGCEFGCETIIFGLNTQGKSTLTAILRSVQTGNNDILIGRKTFGVAGAKKVEIDFEEAGVNDKYTFQNRAWNKSNSDILIFDSKFISENVFDGENITFDQQKKLNTVIIGKRGQELNKEIATLQKQSDDFTTQKTEKTREFSRHFPNLDFGKFKSFSKDNDIDQKINEKENEIKFEQGKEEIKKVIRNHILSLSSIRFSIKGSLVKTLDVKQEEIENHIKLHFSNEKNAQNFLSEGLCFLKNKTENTKRSCVFCGQELGEDAESLISVYSTFFKGGYQELQNEVNNVIDYFKNLNIEVTLEKISADLRAKGLDIGLNETNISSLGALKKEFEQELDKKRDLNYVVNFTSFESLKIGLEKIRTDLERLEQKKLNIKSVKTLLQLETEKKGLEIIKKRYESSWITFCSELAVIEASAEKIRAERDVKRKELETYSLDMFNVHKKTINRLCKDMGADFEIEDFVPLKKIVGKNERIFALKFFGTHKISIDGEDEKKPNFRNTLSESDKRLLAFAFFVSLLEHDRDLDKKIVVFDDPMSSFDTERRRKTLHCIIHLSCKYKENDGSEKTLTPKQKIILTHEDRFAKDLKKHMPDAHSLKIVEYLENENKRSKILHADFFEDFPDDDISQKIDKVKGILDTRSFSTPFSEDCRIILEHIFKRKYYLELKDEISSRKSIRTFTTTLKTKKIGGFDNEEKAQKFILLCNDLNIELHDNSSNCSNGDKESIIRDFFECLKNI